jgi:hypothetical protein
LACCVVRKSVELFRENGNVERKTGSGKLNKTRTGVEDNARKIMEATLSASIRRHYC